MIGLFLWTEVLIRDPTIAAVLAAIVLAFLDWWRRKRRLLVRKDDTEPRRPVLHHWRLPSLPREIDRIGLGYRRGRQSSRLVWPCLARRRPCARAVTPEAQAVLRVGGRRVCGARRPPVRVCPGWPTGPTRCFTAARTAPCPRRASRKRARLRLCQTALELGPRLAHVLDLMLTRLRRMRHVAVLDVPAAVVVRDEDDARRLGDVLQEFHPAPAGPRELRQVSGEDQALRSAGHGDERVAIELEPAVEEVLEVRLIPRIAAVHDDGRRVIRIDDDRPGAVTRRYASLNRGHCGSCERKLACVIVTSEGYRNLGVWGW